MVDDRKKYCCQTQFLLAGQRTVAKGSTVKICSNCAQLEEKDYIGHDVHFAIVEDSNEKE